jgi:hypothetical protein
MVDGKEAAFLADEPDWFEALLCSHATLELRNGRRQIQSAFAYIREGRASVRLHEREADRLRGNVFEADDGRSSVYVVLGLQDE